MKYVVLYQSDTGNTEKIAVSVYEELPGYRKDLCRIESLGELPEADYYFIGFSVFQGTCRMQVMDVLSQIHEKKVAFFATCGSEATDAYREQVEKRVRLWLDADNEYLGLFLCQGKMTESLRTSYMQSPESGQKIGTLLSRRVFDQAKLHPDERDEAAAREFVREICIRQGYLIG